MKNNYITSLIIVFSMCACGKNDPIIQAEPKGIWVESSSRTDTLFFFDGDNGKLQFSSTLENQNGFLLPKPGRGIYFYSLKNDSIGLRNSSSSNMAIKTYTFAIDSKNMMIGDFYNKTGIPDGKLKFEKLP